MLGGLCDGDALARHGQRGRRGNVLGADPGRLCVVQPQRQRKADVRELKLVRVHRAQPRGEHAHHRLIAVQVDPIEDATDALALRPEVPRFLPNADAHRAARLHDDVVLGVGVAGGVLRPVLGDQVIRGRGLWSDERLGVGVPAVAVPVEPYRVEERAALLREPRAQHTRVHLDMIRGLKHGQIPHRDRLDVRAVLKPVSVAPCAQFRLGIDQQPAHAGRASFPRRRPCGADLYLNGAGLPARAHQPHLGGVEQVPSRHGHAEGHGPVPLAAAAGVQPQRHALYGHSARTVLDRSRRRLRHLESRMLLLGPRQGLDAPDIRRNGIGLVLRLHEEAVEPGRSVPRVERKGARGEVPRQDGPEDTLAVNGHREGPAVELADDAIRPADLEHRPRVDDGDHPGEHDPAEGVALAAELDVALGFRTFEDAREIGRAVVRARRRHLRFERHPQRRGNQPTLQLGHGSGAAAGAMEFEAALPHLDHPAADLPFSEVLLPPEWVPADEAPLRGRGCGRTAPGQGEDDGQ